MAKASEKSAAKKSGKDSGDGRKGAAEKADTKTRAKSSAANKPAAKKPAAKKPAAKKPAAGSRTNSPAKSTKQSDSKKSDSKKSDSDSKKSDSKKSDSKESDSKKSETKSSGRGSAKKSGTGASAKKAGTKAPARTARTRKAESGKAGGRDRSEAGSRSGGKSGGGKARPTANTPEIPSTLERSPDPKAARTFVATHDAAVEQYGRGERATRTALAAVKHSYEKVGDHWEPKDEKGPSDSRAASPRGRSGTSAGGVDATATRAHLYVLAQRLDITGRSRMSKEQLIEALQKANDAATARARR